MIKINDKLVTQAHFPDNSLRIETEYTSSIFDLSWLGKTANTKTITWHYEDDSELFTIICLRKHFANDDMILNMPYCPHARMDRVKSSSEFFTLKHFADVINDLNFTEVRVLDPHSNVCAALLNNIVVSNPREHISKALEKIGSDI